MNNAHLKLNSMSEFTALWNSGERFRRFAEQVYRYLERMKPGTVLVLERYSGEQLEWIIKTACVFILEGDNLYLYLCFIIDSQFCSIGFLNFSATCSNCAL